MDIMSALSGFLGQGGVILVAFLFVITLVVFVHELGHFLAARWCGVRVDSFSIGFGRALISFTDRHGTVWKFGWLPLGGYVKFWGDDGVSSTPDHEKLDTASVADRAQSFHHKALYQKAIIAVAGPVANFLLAIFILSSLFLIYGTRVTSPQIGGVNSNSPAETAGLKTGDIVRSIDGSKVVEFDDILRVVTVSNGKTLQFVVDRAGEQLALDVTPQMIVKPDMFGDKILDPGIGVKPVYPGEVKSVDPDSPAAKAGLRAGDIIVGANKTHLNSLADFTDELRKAKGAPLLLTVSRSTSNEKKPWERKAEKLSLEARIPTSSATDPDLFVKESAGFEVVVKGAPKSVILVTFGPVDAVSRSMRDIKYIVVKTFYFIGQLLTGTGDYRQLSGPVGIASVSGQVLSQFGWVSLINLAAVLSVSIGLLNLFPIPMLDGGHLLYYGIEALRGRPLGERAQELGFRIGLAFVVCLLLFATWNDLVKQGLFGALGLHS